MFYIFGRMEYLKLIGSERMIIGRIFTIIGCLVAAAIAALIPTPSMADWPFPAPAYAFIGADQDMRNRAIFCHDGVMTSNLGIGQTLYKSDRVEIDAQWTHHSCITEYRDKQVYDGLGVKAKVYLWSK